MISLSIHGPEDRLSWLIQPLGPALILGIGALALVLSHAFPWRRPIPVIASLALAGAGGVLIALRTPRAAILVGRPWTSILFDIEGGLVWRIDAWAWSGGLVVLLLAWVLFLLAWDEGGRLAPYYRAADLALTATTISVLFADNLLTLASMWVLMESVALARLALEPTQRVETGRVGLSAASALFMALACSLSGPALVMSPLSTAAFTPLVQGMLILAIALRAAVYPFHGWLTHSRLSFIAGRLPIYLIPAMVGLWLLGMLNLASITAWLDGLPWMGFLALSLLGSALAAWIEPGEGRSLDLIAANRAGFILLAVILWPGQSTLAVAGGLFAFGLGMALLYVARLVNEDWGGRWPAAIAILTLLGYPATVGFMELVGVARSAPLREHLGFWGTVTGAEILLLATLLRGWRQPLRPLPRRVSGPQTRLLIASISLAVPVLAIGLQPAIMAHLIGTEEAPGGILALARGMPLAAWIRLLAVSLLGFGLSRLQRPAWFGWQEMQRGVARVARLDWVYGLIHVVLLAILAFWREVLRITEGEGYLGWLLLLLVLAWFLLSPVG